MRFVKVLLSLTLTRSIFSLLSFLSAIQGTEAEALAPFLQTPIWSLKSSSWKSTGKELEQPNRLSTLKIMMILCYSKRNSNHSKSCYKLEYQYCGEHNISRHSLSVVSVAETPLLLLTNRHSDFEYSIIFLFRNYVTAMPFPCEVHHIVLLPSSRHFHPCNRTSYIACTISPPLLGDHVHLA